MDIISHGLYGGVAFGRTTRLSYWKAFFFGIAPDLFSFGIFFIFGLIGLASRPDWNSGPPDPALIPQYVHVLYNLTHSFVIAGAVIGSVWLVSKKLSLEMLAWPLHILVDIPTHSLRFFPTPFAWPLSEYRFDGVSWGTPVIFYSNIAILVLLYLWFYLGKRSAH